MLSITEIEQINQKLNPELALSLSLDNAKRMESSLLHSGFSPSTDMWKLILFYNGSLEEIKEMISFSFIPLLGNFAILFIKEKDIPSFLTFPQVLYVELSRPIYENALTGIDASCFPDYNIVTGRNVNATTLTGKGTDTYGYDCVGSQWDDTVAESGSIGFAGTGCVGRVCGYRDQL